MGFDYSKLRWDDLVGRAMEDYRLQQAGGGFDSSGVYRNFGTADSFDPTSSGRTNIGGIPAQISFGSNTSPANMSWDKAQFNIDDPAGPQGYNTSLYRKDDGTVGVRYYKDTGDLGFLKDMAMFGGTAFGLNAALGALGSAAGGAGGWTSGYDLAGGASLPTGGSALTSGASGLAGSAASGAGEAAAPGWVSAEGGAGYAGGMAADAATGNAFTNALAGASKFLSNPLVQVGTSLVGGLLGNRAADKAADAQTAAANAAIAEQRRQYDQTRTDLAPWRDRGVAASNRLATMMGLSGQASDPNYGTGVAASPRYTPRYNVLSKYISG